MTHLQAIEKIRTALANGSITQGWLVRKQSELLQSVSSVSSSTMNRIDIQIAQSL